MLKRCQNSPRSLYLQFPLALVSPAVREAVYSWIPPRGIDDRLQLASQILDQYRERGDVSKSREYLEITMRHYSEVQERNVDGVPPGITIQIVRNLLWFEEHEKARLIAAGCPRWSTRFLCELLILPQSSGFRRLLDALRQENARSGYSYLGGDWGPQVVCVSTSICYQDQPIFTFSDFQEWLNHPVVGLRLSEPARYTCLKRSDLSPRQRDYLNSFRRIRPADNDGPAQLSPAKLSA